ncbi:MAG: trigger factor [Muribaculaceae bacterium]|nr:trigger factor [Muribaculaceae bacterium]
MNVNFAKIDDVTGELIVTLEEKDYADKVKKELKEIGKKHTEPGFRPGKVPAGLIQKKYGNAVKYDVINKTIGDAVFEFLKKEDMRVLGNPMPDKDNVVDFDADNFTFKFKVGLAPEIDVPVNKDLHVPAYNIQVSDEMLEEQDKGLRQRFGKQISGEVVEPEAVIKGSITELNPDGTVKEDGVKVEDGIISLRYFKSDDQKKLFDGKKVGDEVVFNPAATCDTNPVEMSSMLQINKDDVENHKGDFLFNIKDIIVVRPAELGEEYYENLFGKDKVHNEEEYRAALKELIENQLKADSDFRFTIDAKDAIINAVGEVKMPDEVLKDFLISRNKDLNEENIEEEYVKIRPQLVWELLRDETARKLEIKLEEEDVRKMAENVARSQFAQYGIANPPAEMLEKYANDMLKNQQAREQIANQAVDTKLFNAIRASVTTDEKSVSVEEFNKLFMPAAE